MSKSRIILNAAKSPFMLKMYVAAALYTAGLWLCFNVSWKLCLGVFLVACGLTLEQRAMREMVTEITLGKIIKKLEEYE
jgi:membrane protein implicated in regulation of membrane protease activity